MSRRGWRKGPGAPPLPGKRLEDVAACAVAWETARNPLALRHAIRLCAASGALPPWLAEAIERTLKGNRHYARMVDRHIRDMMDRAHYVAVSLHRSRGLTWPDAYEAAAADAAELAQQTQQPRYVPAVGAEAIAKAYKRARRLLRTAPPAWYDYPPPPRE